MLRLTCRTCGEPLDRPWRIWNDDGSIMGGCVSKDHNGRIPAPSESAGWHNRKEAKALRAKDKTANLIDPEFR